MAQLMVTMNNLTVSYARALLARTPVEQTTRMEEETDKLQREIRGIEASYGEDQLKLGVVGGYVVSLLRNAQITDAYGSTS